MRVLVDTPVWSLAVRRTPRDLHPAERRLVEEWKALVLEQRAVINGPVRQEVLTGIRSLGDFERLRGRLRVFPDAPLETGDFEEAARGLSACRAAGIAATDTDLLLCAQAHRLGLSILTTDGDFALCARAIPVVLHDPR